MTIKLGKLKIKDEDRTSKAKTTAQRFSIKIGQGKCRGKRKKRW